MIVHVGVLLNSWSATLNGRITLVLSVTARCAALSFISMFFLFAEWIVLFLQGRLILLIRLLA